MVLPVPSHFKGFVSGTEESYVFKSEFAFVTLLPGFAWQQHWLQLVEVKLGKWSYSMPVLNKLCFFTTNNERGLIKQYFIIEEKKKKKKKEKGSNRIIKKAKEKCFLQNHRMKM